MKKLGRRAFLAAAAGVTLTACTTGRRHGSGARKQPNVVFILTDDHRYDAAGFMGHPYLETPNMDRMAREGVHFENAFVTTSLCSPSRASILTGLYTHNHGVVDNYNPLPEGLTFFPEYMQNAGYETAFIGKWHIGGDVDAPQPGFDYWLSFKGQGTYWPDGHGTVRFVPQVSYEGFNINGKRVPQRGYITDELTDYALDWLGTRTSQKPYMLYISHKAVHSDFVAADRHLGRYADKDMRVPATFPNTPENYKNKPLWLKNQRNSRHGADYAYNLDDFDLNAYHRRYCESLLAVDENLGRILDFLEARGELDDTIVIYMGDNGFQFGEQGLIDKRTAYEASIRVPLLMRCPALFPKGVKEPRVAANIDIAPTMIDIAGARIPKHMDGRSLFPLAKGEAGPWRDALLYEYFWEWNYPHTPTIHALLTERYKFIRYHGIWDVDELYDLEADPEEQHNLIFEPEHQERAAKMRTRLFEVLEETGGNVMRVLPDRGKNFPWRHKDRAQPGEYPKQFFEMPEDYQTRK